MSPSQANQLIARALRWHTDASASETEKSAAGDSASLKAIALDVTRRNMQSGSDRVSNGAVRNFIQMEKMNQADEIASRPKAPQPHVHGHIFLTAEQARLSEIATELGLEGVLEAATEGSGDGGDEAAHPSSFPATRSNGNGHHGNGNGHSNGNGKH